MNVFLNGFFTAFPFILLHDGGWHMMGWWGVPFMGYWFIGIVIGVILIVVYFIIHSEKNDEVDIMSDAQKTIDERYVKGEMTNDEYIQAKDDLKNFKPK